MRCDCGQKVLTIRFKGFRRVCDSCEPTSLSGSWERNNQQERNKYAKDILQEGQPGFKETYGKAKNNTTKSL